MSKHLVFDDFSVEYLQKKRLKHTYISLVYRGNEIILRVKSPTHVALQDIEKFLEEKRQWIYKQKAKLLKNLPSVVRLEDEVLLFGEVYSIDDERFSSLQKDLSKVQTQDILAIQKCYDKFYMHYAQEYFKQRVEYFTLVMNLSYKELRYKKLKSRWGSCNSLGVITLNTQLLKCKKELIDYIIVHELSHLVYMNHSKAFHSLVRTYLSDEKERRAELKGCFLAD